MKMIHLPFLDGIRGIAILSVFLFHALGASFGLDALPWNGLFRNFDVSRSFLALYPITYGSAGVAIFIVVSGFCIHLSYERSKDKSWLLFVKKRFFRIYPPYFLALILFSFLWPWGRISLDNLLGFAQFFAHALAVHNYDHRTFFGINPSFWSIAVEIQLYAIYPLLVLFMSSLGWMRTLFIAGFTQICASLYSSINSLLSDSPPPLYITASPFAYWLSWSLGAYMCHCYLTNKTPRLLSIRFDLVCILALALPFFKPSAPFAFLAFSLLTAIAIERLTTEKWTLPSNVFFRWVWSHLSFLGVISYSFYLLHQPFIGLFARVGSTISESTISHPLLVFLFNVVSYPIILGASYLAYCYIELPFMRIGKTIGLTSRCR